MRQELPSGVIIIIVMVMIIVKITVMLVMTVTNTLMVMAILIHFLVQASAALYRWSPNCWKLN